MTAPAWATYDILEWGEIPGTYQTGSAGDVTSAGGDSPGVQRRLTNSGMALTADGEVVLMGDGGHTDYKPNEVARLKLNVDVPAWELGDGPSSTIPNGTPYGTDGKFAATHTYWSLTEVAGVVYRMYTRYSGDAAYNGPESNTYTLATNTRSPAGTVADAPTITEAVDADGNLWGHTATDLYKYTTSTNTWSSAIHASADISGSPIVYDPANDDFVCFCWGDGQGAGTAATTFFRVGKTGARTALTVNTSAAYTEWQSIQARYHSVVKHPRIANTWVVFSPAGSGTITNKIYLLTLNGGAYDMTVLATTGVALPPCIESGSYNRFAYSDALKGFVYMPRAEVNMLFLRDSGTPAPGRTTLDSTLKFLTKLQDGVPTEIISGRTITKVGGCALDGSGEGFAFSNGEVLTVTSFPYFAPPFTMGVRLKQASGSGNNVGMVGLNIDSDAKVFTLHLDTNNNAHAWSRGSDIGDAGQTFNAFAYDEWFTYAAVFHADGTRSVYDSSCGMVSNSDIIDMTGSAAELYIGSYPRSDTPWTANGLEAWIFFFTTDKTKGDLDLIDANPDSLLVASLPDLTGTSASTQGLQVSAGSGGVKVTGAAASTQGLQVATTSGAVKVSGAAASTQLAQTSTAMGAVKTSGSGVSAQGQQISAAAGTVKIAGVAASSQGLQVSSGSGSVSSTGDGGTAASTQGLQVSWGTGSVAISGAAASMQGPQVSAAVGSVADPGTISGAAASAQARQVSAATGSVMISGAAASTQGSQVSTGDGDVEDTGAITGIAASAQGFQVSTGAGSVAISGAAASAQGLQISTGRGTNSSPKPAPRTPQMLPLFQRMSQGVLSVLGMDAVYDGIWTSGATKINVQYGVQITGLTGDASMMVGDYGAERDVATISSTMNPQIGDTFQLVDPLSGGTPDMPMGVTFRLEKRIRNTGVNQQFIVLMVA